MKEQIKKSSISSLAPLLLFVIFTTCILSVLLTGADVYQKISERDQNSFQCRTTAQYITTRLRQSDAVGMSFVGDFHALAPEDSGNTLFICEELGGRTFYTRIYCHDGYLRELFAEASLSFSPEAGEKILAINDLTFRKQDDLLYIEIEHADATVETLILHIRSGKEQSL